MYKKLTELQTRECFIDTKLRIKPSEIIEEIDRKKLVLAQLYKQVGQSKFKTKNRDQDNRNN